MNENTEQIPLSDEDRVLADRIGFDAEVLQIVKQETRADSLSLLAKTEIWGTEYDSAPVREEYALTAKAPHKTSEEVVRRLQAALQERGYQPFIYDTDFGMQGQPDRIAVLRDNDFLAPVRFMGTSAPNYDLGPEDILAKLETWSTQFGFDVLAAERDALELRLDTLPPNLDAFAVELYDFCPDLLDQGIECMIEDGYEFLPEERQKEIDAYLEADTGEEESKTHRVALQILAEDIRKERRFRLWWD